MDGHAGVKMSDGFCTWKNRMGAHDEQSLWATFFGNLNAMNIHHLIDDFPKKGECQHWVDPLLINYNVVPSTVKIRATNTDLKNQSSGCIKIEVPNGLMDPVEKVLLDPVSKKPFHLYLSCIYSLYIYGESYLQEICH